jgi:hypothetical protein
MKTAILIVYVAFLITLDCNSQWYKKYFGVNEPDQLSVEQINMALTKSRDGLNTGITLSIVSAIGIVSGLYLFDKDYPDNKYPEQAEIGKKFAGLGLALISVPTEIIGLVILNNNRLRHLEIENFNNHTEMKIGLNVV